MGHPEGALESQDEASLCREVDRYILAVNTNQTNAMVKMNMKRNLKRNYDDVSRSPLLSPVLPARLATTDPLS